MNWPIRCDAGLTEGGYCRNPALFVQNLGRLSAKYLNAGGYARLQPVAVEICGGPFMGQHVCGLTNENFFGIIFVRKQIKRNAWLLRGACSGDGFRKAGQRQRVS